MAKIQPTNRVIVSKRNLARRHSSDIVPIHHEPQYANTYFQPKHYDDYQSQPSMKAWLQNNRNQQERPVSAISSKHIDYSSNDRFKNTKTTPKNEKNNSSKILKIVLVSTIIFLMLTAIGISIYVLVNSKMSTTITTTTSTSTSTSTSTTTTTTTTTTTPILPSQCSSYTPMTDASRLATASGGYASDLGVFSSTYVWYRFYGAGGTEITTFAPNYFQCGGYYSGWYSGTMPTYGGTNTGTVCYVYTTDCYYSNTILVTNCGSFYIYGLINPPVTYARYCTL